ncbi:MAG: 1,2-dihydroxy-3-keto-5-methylthiopentene dioxygenase [Thioalkalivibrionaceae bacterium]
MSTTLTLYPDHAPDQGTRLVDRAEIVAALADRGIGFERWEAHQTLAANATAEDILAAYGQDIERLKRSRGFTTADVIRMTPEHPDREALRAKFLDEHTHSEDEVRFFVEGSGLFVLHLGEEVCALHAHAGDLVAVPAGTPHWFDMGPAPRFTAIRLFTNTEGWVAHFTGDPIAQRFPRLDNA